MKRTDPRADLARAMSLRDVMARLPLSGLRRAGQEHVGPCPQCGGTDRFAINPARGVFLCRVCGAGGDGIALAQHVLGCDFKGALDHLVGAADHLPAPEEMARRQARARAEAERQDRIAQAERARAIRDAASIWRRALSADASLVVAYLERRGIVIEGKLPVALRYLPDHPYVRRIGGDLVTLHRGPAMIAAVQGVDDRLSAVHQTWIDLNEPGGKAAIVGPDGRTLPAKMVRGSKKGGAIRLGRDPGQITGMVMGEGIETTLTARTRGPYDPPAVYWAGVDLGNISGRMLPAPRGQWSGQPDLGDERAFVPPAWVRRLVLIEDSDSHPEKTRAQILSGLRRAQHFIPGLRAAIACPPAGQDLNDVLQAQENLEKGPEHE